MTNIVTGPRTIADAGSDEMCVRETADCVVHRAVPAKVLERRREQLAGNGERRVGPEAHCPVRHLRARVVPAGAEADPARADEWVHEVERERVDGLRTRGQRGEVEREQHGQHAQQDSQASSRAHARGQKKLAHFGS
jgi:hypothetical protein